MVFLIINTTYLLYFIHTDPKIFEGNTLNTSENIDGYFKQLKQLKPFLDTASYPQNLKKLETIFIRREICKKNVSRSCQSLGNESDATICFDQ